MAVALVATHLGVVDEEQLNNMSIVLFENILDTLGQKLIYEAVVNYAGNSFCEKSWDMIMEHYPLDPKIKNKGRQHGGLSGLAKLAQNGKVRVMSKGDALPGSLGRMMKGRKHG